MTGVEYVFPFKLSVSVKVGFRAPNAAEVTLNVTVQVAFTAIEEHPVFDTANDDAPLPDTLGIALAIFVPKFCTVMV